MMTGRSGLSVFKLKFRAGRPITGPLSHIPPSTGGLATTPLRIGKYTTAQPLNGHRVAKTVQTTAGPLSTSFWRT